MSQTPSEELRQRAAEFLAAAEQLTRAAGVAEEADRLLQQAAAYVVAAGEDPVAYGLPTSVGSAQLGKVTARLRQADTQPILREGQVFCYVCGGAIPAAAEQCPLCQAALQPPPEEGGDFCEECGRALQAGANFCPQCRTVTSRPEVDQPTGQWCGLQCPTEILPGMTHCPRCGRALTAPLDEAEQAKARGPKPDELTPPPAKGSSLRRRLGGCLGRGILVVSAILAVMALLVAFAWVVSPGTVDQAASELDAAAWQASNRLAEAAPWADHLGFAVCETACEDGWPLLVCPNCPSAAPWREREETISASDQPASQEPEASPSPSATATLVPILTDEPTPEAEPEDLEASSALTVTPEVEVTPFVTTTVRAFWMGWSGGDPTDSISITLKPGDEIGEVWMALCPTRAPYLWVADAADFPEDQAANGDVDHILDANWFEHGPYGTRWMWPSVPVWVPATCPDGSPHRSPTPEGIGELAPGVQALAGIPTHADLIRGEGRPEPPPPASQPAPSY